jgi:uncharacterized protein (DUF302 family)
MPPFDYSVTTSKSFDEAVASVEAKCREKNFGVLHIHDVKTILAAKGFDREPLKIIEVCNPRYASETLNKDIRTALMLPCPITVYSLGGVTHISALRPNIIKDFYPGAGLEDVAGIVDRIIVSIVDEAK